MIKRGIKILARSLGYEINKIIPHEVLRTKARSACVAAPPPLEPIWPLPRKANGFSDSEIHHEFSRHSFWHYPYAFEGGLSFPISHSRPDALINDPRRHFQRFRHFMPYVLASQGGSLKGKRILDIACNSGFWSIQCALLGAEVVGVDARIDMIAQADLIKSIIGLTNVTFKTLTISAMNQRILGGTFDMVLNSGLLFHLPDPLEALRRTKDMSHDKILLDTAVFKSDNQIIHLRWEEPCDIWAADCAGIVAFPSRNGIDIMLRHLRMSSWFEIPNRTKDLPQDYLDHKRVSWLISV
jgi:SAM-dependent methyltransferase